MPYGTADVLPLLALLGVVLAITLLCSALLSTHLMLVEDVSTYEAGIPSSHHLTGEATADAYAVVWYLLMQETLLVWLLPLEMYIITPLRRRGVLQVEWMEGC